ncbi:MAG TPA: TetR/AcrR family transcriptional regulator [Gaiellaceae bacterium]|nr:TetR/AcrR family transcriptional regulator [Gaiellaceae bacterium]
MDVRQTSVRTDPARERILTTAYELFSRRGIRDVGIGEVVERASIAKATLYRHFPSKNDLVLAFLDRRERVWTRQTLEAGARRRGTTAERQLLALFDVLDDWFHRPDFESCSFINVLLEMRPTHPAGQAAIDHLNEVRGVVKELAGEAGLREVDSFATAWHLLMNGSIVSAAAGDTDAAQPAKELARVLIEQHRG